MLFWRRLTVKMDLLNKAVGKGGERGNIILRLAGGMVSKNITRKEESIWRLEMFLMVPRQL